MINFNFFDMVQVNLDKLLNLEYTNETKIYPTIKKYEIS